MTYLYIDLMSVEMNGCIHVDTKYSNKEILSCGMHYKGASNIIENDASQVTFGMLKILQFKKP